MKRKRSWKWHSASQPPFVRILNPSDEFVKDMAREKAGRKEAWNASRAEALKEAAGIAKRYGHKLWPLEGSSHDDLERRVFATIIRACEAIVQAIEARMK